MLVQANTFGDLQNNCYLITDEKSGQSALVDCTEFSPEMERFIGKADLRWILLTHGHFDHIGGIKDVQEKYGAKIVVSRIDAPMLTSSRESLAAFCHAVHKDAAADIMVQDGDVIEVGASKIRVMETPGHTPGSVCYIADDMIFSGDTLFFCSCGRTDLPGGSAAQMQASLKKIAALPGNYTVYPGHDRQSSLDFERQNNPYMSE